MLIEQRLPHQLRVQSQQIDKVLDHRQMEAHVSGGVITPKSIQYSLQTQLSSGMERLKEFKQDILSALGVSDVKLMHESGQWRLKIDRVEEPLVGLLDMLSHLPDVSPGTAVLGLTEENEPLLVDLTDSDLAHLLIVGESGAGKTSLIRSLAISLALLHRQSQLQLVVINGNNPKDSSNIESLEPLTYLPHLLEPVVSDTKDGVDVLQFLVEEMNYRTEQAVQHPVIVLLIDHLVSFLEETDGDAYELILQLAQKGAEAGIHLIMSTQRPESSLITAVFKSAIPVRIIGRMSNEQSSLNVTGMTEIHPEYLYGEGDFVAVTSEGSTHFQAAFIGDYDLHLTLDTLHRNRPRPLIAQAVAVNPKPSDIDAPEDDETTEPELIHFSFDGQKQSWEKPQQDDEEIPFDAGIDWQTELGNKENNE